MFLTNITSFVFNLVIMCFVALWLSYRILETRIEPEKPLRKSRFYTLFTILSIFSMLTLLSYVFAPKRIFTNASHHVIEHLGFSFQNELYLSNQSNPEEAIWDKKNGELSLNANHQKNGFQLKASNFYEPIFIKKGIYYQLGNALISEPVEKELSVMLADTLGINILVKQKEKHYTIRVFLNGKVFGPYTSLVRFPIHTGYYLTSFLNGLPADIPEMTNLTTALSGSLLLREKDTKQTEGNPLIFFPSAALIESNPVIRINGKTIDLKAENYAEINLDAEIPFYVGLWNTQMKTYKAVYKNSACLLLSTFPDKKYLKNTEAEKELLFVTSSANEIAKNNLTSGFYYPILVNESNRHHISATLSYQTGATKEKMSFRIINLDQNDFSDNRKSETFMAGDTIYIKTKGSILNAGNTQWLFKIKDLKADNPLQFWHLIAINVLLLLMIFISMWLTPYHEQSKTEYITYIFIICLMTIRSVLIWRVSTFIPTEDMTENIFRQLTVGMFSNFKNGAIASITFFMALCVWKTIPRQLLKNLKTPLFLLKSSYSDYLLLCLYILCIGVKILGVQELERISSIFMPLVIYVFIEFCYLYQLHRQQHTSGFHKRYRMLAIANWLICFGYLAISDAGFSIVFFIATLIYWLLQTLTFPAYLQHATSDPWFGSLRHFRFISPIIVLITFIIFSPYLISWIFLRTRFFLTIMAVFMATFGFSILFLKKHGSSRLKATFSIGIFCSGILLFVLRDTVAEKIQEKSYIRYRAEVLFKTPDEIIKDEAFQFSSGNDSKLLRAAQNQWFINYYYENGITGHVSPFIQLFKGNYFQLLPSFQKGSPYLTQISDLVSVRYVIGEHSQLIIFILLAQIIILIVSAIGHENPFNFYGKLRIFLLCLLFAVGFFIWMAATNRIIFLGQDFPLLSLNSILTLLFTFSILFFVVCFGRLSGYHHSGGSFNAYGGKIFYAVIRLVMLTGILLILFRKHDFSEKRFNLDDTIALLREDFYSLNISFAKYQEANPRLSQSIPSLLEGFEKHQALEKSDIFKTEFSRSAFKAYLKVLKKQNNSQNLIHVKRTNEGKYTFVINKLYYEVLSPDLTNGSWKGHLVSTNNQNAHTLINRDTQREYVLDPSITNNNLEKALTKNGIHDFSENHNIRFTMVPASWTTDSLPRILVSSTSGQQAVNRTEFTIKNKDEIIRSGSSAKALVLKAGDIIQFFPANSQLPATLQYLHQPKVYLAKNVWLNGKNQFFYPLKHKFVWPYHFANLVKTKFNGQPKQLTQDLAITIDADLTAQIYDIVDDYFKKPLWKKTSEENNRAFNMVLLDNNGKIILLSDFQKGLPIKFDPNHINEYKESLDKIYLSADTDSERLIFGNRCLLRSDNGPASTFKPVLYAAVTSQFNFDWPHLSFGGLSTAASIVRKSGPDSYVVNKFGNKPVNFNLISPNFPAHNNIFYISQSTNSYNSMITFLGSLDKPQIGRLVNYIKGYGNDSTFLKRGLSINQAENFPDFRMGNQSFRINHFPTWSNEHSLLAKGLWENFNLPVRPEQLKGTEGQNIQNIAYDLDSVGFAQSKSSFRLWSFPEPSHLYLIDRNNLHNAVVQVASGADPINTTPLKMAEMAGALFSFNKGFKATVLTYTKAKYKPLSADQTWGGANHLSAFYADNLFRGMHESIVQGTARDLIGTYLTKNYPGYYFYAKTGTISGNSSKSKRDKHLMLIISKNNLHGQLLTTNELKNNRFYVLYISFYKQSANGSWGTAANVLQAIVKKVIESSSFQTHINHE